MTEVVLIDDDEEVLAWVSQEMKRRGRSILTLNPVAGPGADPEAKAEEIYAAFRDHPDAIFLIDVLWRDRQAGQSYNALDVLEELLMDVARPATPAKAYLATGYDVGLLAQGDAHAETARALIMSWNLRLEGQIAVDSVLAKPFDADQILTLAAKDPPEALLETLHAMVMPARLIDPNGNPAKRNDAWTWALTEPQSLRPQDERTGATSSQGVVSEILGGLTPPGGDGQTLSYILSSTRSIGETGWRIEYALPAPHQATLSGTPDDTLRAIALFADHAFDCDRLRFYERVRHAQTDDKPASHLRLRASLRVRDGAVLDETPHPERGELRGTLFFSDRLPAPPSQEQSGPGSAPPGRYLCMELPDPSPLRLDPAMPRRPLKLIYEARRAGQQLALETDPKRREFLQAWNDRLGVAPGDCWIELPVYKKQTNNGTCYDTEGWLIFQHRAGAAELGKTPEAALRHKFERRSLTMRTFCVNLSHQMRNEREQMLRRAETLIKTFFRREFDRSGGAGVADLQSDRENTRRLFETLLIKSAEWLDADYAAIVRKASPRSAPALEASVKRKRGKVARLERVRPEKRRALTKDNYPALFEALEENRLINWPCRRRPSERSYRARLAAPICIGDRQIGAISLVARTPWTFDARRVELLELIIEEGRPFLAAWLDKLDRFAWEGALVHEIRRATRRAESGLVQARDSVQAGEVAEMLLKDLDRAQGGIEDLHSIVWSFAVLGGGGGSSLEKFDAYLRIKALTQLPEARLRDMLDVRFEAEGLGAIEIVPPAMDAK